MWYHDKEKIRDGEGSQRELRGTDCEGMEEGERAQMKVEARENKGIFLCKSDVKIHSRLGLPKLSSL